MGLIYMATNTLNGKRYIGQTHQSLKSRIAGHVADAKSRGLCRAFANALNKYGAAVFRWEILQDGILLQETMDEAEGAAISKYKTITPHGYNLRTGGARGRHSEESKAKMRMFQNAPESKAWQTARSLRGWTAEKKTKMRAASSTPEARKKQSIAMKKRWENPAYRARYEGKRRGENRKETLGRRVACIETGKVYKSAAAAARDTGANYASVCLCLSGRRKTAGGKHWRRDA